MEEKTLNFSPKLREKGRPIEMAPKCGLITEKELDFFLFPVCEKFRGKRTTNHHP